MPWKLCAGHGAADVGPPRPRSCGHVGTKTLNQCVFERHAAVRHERAVPAYGSFLFRDDLKPSPTQWRRSRSGRSGSRRTNIFAKKKKEKKKDVCLIGRLFVVFARLV